MSAADSVTARRMAVVRVFIWFACSSAPVNDRWTAATCSW